AGAGLLALAGGRLANEDLFNLRKLVQGLNGKLNLYSRMGGGELTTQIGLPAGSNLGSLGKGDAILVAGCDLEEEAPLWWLRVRQAAQRGATLIVLNARSSKLDRDATFALRYPFGSAAAAVLALVNAISKKQPELGGAVQELERSPELAAAAAAFAAAANAVVFYGSDAQGLPETTALAQACANLLVSTNHVRRPNNGLVAAWPRNNDQGAWEIGYRPSANLPADLAAAQALYIVAADPVGDDPAFQPVFGSEKFVVVQDFVLTPTARLADVVLPAQTFTEREGTYTNGERRVQRFYPAAHPKLGAPAQVEAPSVRRSQVLTGIRPPFADAQPDYTLAALVAERAGVSGLEANTASLVFNALAKETPAFAGLNYRKLAEVEQQFPIIGRSDLYYGGTGYENKQGLGAVLALQGAAPALAWPQVGEFKLPKLGAVAFPITCLYDHGTTLAPSTLLQERICEAFVEIGPADAARLRVTDGELVRLVFSETGTSVAVPVKINSELPERVVLAPRSYGMPVFGPTAVELKPAG
ncbi:MAG: molybdopterin oxidoreductase family protein, partial [Chloroflexota bacterium]